MRRGGEVTPSTRNTESDLPPIPGSPQDACTPPYPFPDKFFDFFFCSHTLEDLRDPLAVCREMVRVAKAGYIETPSRAREIFCKKRGFALRAALGKIPQVGYDHHRWSVEIEGTHVQFLIKDQRILASRRNFMTKGDLGRNMTEEESGTALFWEESFTFEEARLDDPKTQLREFRDDTLRRLRS
jgi:SAM-dependent methyltransferase